MLAVQVQYWTLQETIRHDIAQENYWTASLQETIRHNQVQENYWFASLAEQQRHDVAQEEIGWANVEASIYSAKARLLGTQISASIQHESNVIRGAELRQRQKEFKWSKTLDQKKFNLDVMKQQVQVVQWATDNISGLMNKGINAIQKIGGN